MAGIDPIKLSGVKLSGTKGDISASKTTKEQYKLTRAIANLDEKGDLSKADIEKLKKMSPEEQIKYLNNALKDTGYKIASVYDAAEDETSSGVHFTSNGVYINYSKDSKYHTNNEHLGITYNKK